MFCMSLLQFLFFFIPIIRIVMTPCSSHQCLSIICIERHNEPNAARLRFFFTNKTNSQKKLCERKQTKMYWHVAPNHCHIWLRWYTLSLSLSLALSFHVWFFAPDACGPMHWVSQRPTGCRFYFNEQTPPKENKQTSDSQQTEAT